MDTPPPTLDDIIASALAMTYAALRGERVEPIGQVLYEARHQGRAALERGLLLLAGDDPVERAVGCDLLGELCNPDDHEFGPEIAAALVSLAAHEEDPDVLRPMVRAMGRAGHPSGVPVLERLSRHPNAEVRFNVAGAVYFCEDDADSTDVQRILLALMQDADDQVRDWATFGVGTQTDLDGPAVREALLANAQDPDPDTRDEAILGLARRRDPRALDIVAARLAEDDVSNMAVEAACYLADERLLPALEELTTSWDLDDQVVTNAVNSCAPGFRARNRQLQEQFLAALSSALEARPEQVGCGLYCERLELGVGLRIERWGVDPAIYDFDALLNVRAGGDVAGAVQAVIGDLEPQPS